MSQLILHHALTGELITNVLNTNNKRACNHCFAVMMILGVHANVHVVVL